MCHGQKPHRLTWQAANQATPVVIVATIPDMAEVEVVVAHHECATLLWGATAGLNGPGPRITLLQAHTR
jgi:hypothetical protein